MNDARCPPNYSVSQQPAVTSLQVVSVEVDGNTRRSVYTCWHALANGVYTRLRTIRESMHVILLCPARWNWYNIQYQSINQSINPEFLKRPESYKLLLGPLERGYVKSSPGNNQKKDLANRWVLSCWRYDSAEVTSSGRSHIGWAKSVTPFSPTSI